MTWTYSGDPEASPRDAVRFWVGDTDEKDQQLNDEELDYILRSSDENVGAASINAARALVGKYSRMVDRSHGDLRVTASQRAQHYRMLRQELEERFGGEVPGAAMVSSGTQRVDNRFMLGMTDRFYGSLNERLWH